MRKPPTDWQILGTSSTPRGKIWHIYAPPKIWKFPQNFYTYHRQGNWKIWGNCQILWFSQILSVFAHERMLFLPDVTTALATSATCLPNADPRIYHLEIRSRASTFCGSARHIWGFGAAQALFADPRVTSGDSEPRIWQFGAAPARC